MFKRRKFSCKNALQEFQLKIPNQVFLKNTPFVYIML